MTEPKLTEKQRRFVEAYCGAANGNATESARRAGYRGNAKTLESMGRENLAKPGIAAAIKAASAAVRSAAVMTRQERQELLSTLARNADVEPRDRIKACEVLGKMQGDFVERHEVEHRTALVSFVFEDNGRGPAPAA